MVQPKIPLRLSEPDQRLIFSGDEKSAGRTSCPNGAFDVLQLQLRGRDLTEAPLEGRKAVLADVVALHDNLVLQDTPGIIGEGRALFEAVRAKGMEGIVAKRLGSRYVPGSRSTAWIKVKVPAYAKERGREWG